MQIRDVDLLERGEQAIARGALGFGLFDGRHSGPAGRGCSFAEKSAPDFIKLQRPITSIFGTASSDRRYSARRWQRAEGSLRAVRLGIGRNSRRNPCPAPTRCARPLRLSAPREPCSRVVVSPLRHVLISSFLETSRRQIVASVTVRFSGSSSQDRIHLFENAGPSEAQTMGFSYGRGDFP